MVRSPSCEKGGLKKGPWTPEEDQKLLAYVEEHGHGSWQALPAKAGLQRCGKSCRLRWTNYLRSDIKRGKFSLQEEQTIIQLHALLGNKWSAIATHLPKRTDNEIKNYWNTHLKKRLEKMGIDPVTHKPKADSFGSSTGNAKDAANLSHIAQWETARLEAEARSVHESKLISNQNQFGFSLPNNKATATTEAASPPVRPKCLDVLKAWQGMVSGMFFVSGGGESLESPTSTLNFSENGLAIPVVGYQQEKALIIPQHQQQQLQFTNGNNNISTCEGHIIDEEITVHEMSSTYNNNVAAWVMETFREANENENHENGINIMDGLSDIIVYNTSIVGENASSESCNGNINLDQHQGNYWNSLLNLAVDVPAAGSSAF